MLRHNDTMTLALYLIHFILSIYNVFPYLFAPVPSCFGSVIGIYYSCS